MSRVDDALLLRDTIRKIIDEKIQKERPGSSYATVTGFNPLTGIITVRYPGDDVDAEIPAGSIYPSEPGQVVKIGGSGGGKVVEDVMGENLTTVEVRTAQATADGKNTVNYGEVPPPGADHKEGDIWFDEGNSNMPNVWDGVEWKSIEDLRVSAIQTAQDELREDLDYVIENGSGTKSFYKPTQPTEAESKEGDIWFDTSAEGNNELHTYVNGVWVSAADARISAIQSAQEALRTDLDDVIENGSGTQTHYSTTMPIVAVSSEGDLWFDPSDNNKPYIFQGGAWVTVRDSYIADKAVTTEKLAVGAITAESGVVASLSAGDITVGILAAARLAANSITVDKLLIGSDRNLLPNGDLRLGGTPGPWPESLTFSTDAPEGHTGSMQGTGSASRNFSAFGTFPVVPGETVVFEFWLKADKPGSKMYMYVRDQTGAFLGRAGNAWATVSGPTSSSLTIPVSNYTIPTTWTKHVTKITIPTGVTAIYLDTVFYNHSNGTERTATQSIAGMKLYKQAGVTLIQDGAITTGKIAVGAITAESGVIASLDAGKISVGTLAAARLAANSITADKILLSAGSNLAPWDQVKRGETVTPHATFSSGDTDGTLALAPGSSSIGVPNHMAWTRSSTQNGSYGPILLAGPNDARIPAEPGGSYTVNVTTYSTDLTCESRLRIYWYGERASDGTYPYGGSVFSTAGAYILSSTPTRRSISVVLPGTARYIVPMVTTEGDLTARRGTVHIVDWELKERIGSTLIEPGAITTEKIAVGAITAESGVVGSLDASKITVGTLSGARLAADAIDGKQIIGATIATSLGFPRVQLDTAGLAIYKSSAVRSFFADATTGDLSIVGDFSTGTSGPRVEIKNSDWNSIAVVDPDTNATTYVNGSGIRIGSSPTDGFSIYHGSYTESGGSTLKQSAVISGPGEKGQLGLFDNGTVFIGTPRVGGGTSGGRFHSFGSGQQKQISWNPNGVERASISTFPSGLIQMFTVNTSGVQQAMLQMSNGTVVLETPGTVDFNAIGDVRVNVQSSAGARFRVPAIYDVQASGSANVVVNSAGTLFRPSSSRRYKQEIEPAEQSPSILDIETKTWLDISAAKASVSAHEYLAEIGQGPLPRDFQDVELEPERHFGAIAEEVHELGLTHLVEYDFSGRPDALKYPMFGVALIPEMRKLRDRITELESKLDTPN